MLTCPWCKHETAAPMTSSCASCGRVPMQHPSIQDDEEGPPLELAPLREAMVRPSAPIKPTAAAKPLLSAADIDLNDDDLPEIPLELDLHRGRLSKPEAPDAKKPKVASAAVASPAVAAAAERARTNRAAGASNAAGAIDTAGASNAAGAIKVAGAIDASVEVDPFEVAATADFGPAARGWLDAPAYAWRVRQRRAALRGEVDRLRQQRAEAEQAKMERLAQLVRVIQKLAAPSDQAKALLAPLAALDQTAAARDAALKGVSASYAESVAEIDTKIAALEDEQAKLEILVQSAQAELERRGESRARAEAKSKRVDIELRAAHEAARVAAGPNAKLVPPEIAPRIVALEEEKAVRAAELKPLAAAFSSAEQELHERETPVREIRHRIASLRAERQKVEDTSARQLAVRSEGVQQVERERLLAYAEVARQLLTTCTDEVPIEHRALAAQATELVASRSHDLEKHARALASADPAAERRGLILIALAIGAVVVLLLSVLRTAAR